MSRRRKTSPGRAERIASRSARLVELTGDPDAEGVVLARRLAEAAYSGDDAAVGELAADATADRLVAVAVVRTLAVALADVARQAGAVV